MNYVFAHIGYKARKAAIARTGRDPGERFPLLDLPEASEADQQIIARHASAWQDGRMMVSALDAEDATAESIAAELRRADAQRRAEANQRAEQRAEEEARERAEAEQQAAGPMDDQIVWRCYGSWEARYSPWQVRSPLCHYNDLSGPAQTEVDRRNAEHRARKAAQAQAKEERKEREEAQRAETLAAAVRTYLPDLADEWEAGRLAERSVVAAIGTVLDWNLAPHEMPEDISVGAVVETLSADVLREWREAQALIAEAFAQTAAELSAELGEADLEFYRVHRTDDEMGDDEWRYAVRYRRAIGGILLSRVWYSS